MADEYLYVGPDYLKRSKKAAILNSRQTKYPHGSDEWIIGSKHATRYLRNNNLALVTSTGMNTWEMTLVLASIEKVPVVVVYPQWTDTPTAVADHIRNDFALTPNLSGFVFPLEKTPPHRKEYWPVRDDLIMRFSDLIIPVAVRKKGLIAELIEKCRGCVVEDFKLDYVKYQRPIPRYEEAKVNESFEFGRWLVHFTRRTAHPWPGESAYDFYRSILESGDKCSHDAASTLENIISTGRIRATSKNIRGGYKVVAFTEIARDNVATIFRYRPRLVATNFEPYGIAIDKDFAQNIGFRPVIYGDAKEYERLPELDRPFFQNRGSRGGQWVAEDEWRIMGDFEISGVPAQFMRIIIPYESEKPRFANQFKGLTLPIFSQ